VGTVATIVSNDVNVIVHVVVFLLYMRSRGIQSIFHKLLVHHGFLCQNMDDFRVVNFTFTACK
jgi:hypothetical protein